MVKELKKDEKSKKYLPYSFEDGSFFTLINKIH